MAMRHTKHMAIGHTLVKHFAWHIAMRFGERQMGRRPSEAQDKFIIRLPDGMREQLKAAAEANDRTMTSEVVARLRASFEKGALQQEPEHASSLFADTVEREFETLRAQVRALVDVQYNLVEELRKREPKA